MNPGPALNVKLDFRRQSPLSVTVSALIHPRAVHPTWHLVFSEIVEQARLSARALLDYGDNLFNPTVRLGVTGLSRAGKTVFITALVHGLTRGGRFPVFESLATGRSPAPALEPQRTMRCRGLLMKIIAHPDRGAPAGRTRPRTSANCGW